MENGQNLKQRKHIAILHYSAKIEKNFSDLKTAGPVIPVAYSKSGKIASTFYFLNPYKGLVTVYTRTYFNGKQLRYMELKVFQVTVTVVLKQI